MRIICPTCASHYEVDAARIAAQGQLVRCARCRDVWLVRSPEARAASRPAAAEAVPSPDAAPEANAPEVAANAPEVIDFQAAKVRLRPRGTPAAQGRDWATSFSVFGIGAVLLSAMLGAYSFRATIAGHVPMTAGIYAALGIPLPGDRLALSDVRSVLVAEGGETVLTLQGRIANTGAEPVAVPKLAVQVRGEAQAPLYTYTASAPKPTLASGESIEFRSRLASPPPSGRDVRVSFAAASPGAKIASR